jgi:hypothetical protein
MENKQVDSSFEELVAAFPNCTREGNSITVAYDWGEITIESKDGDLEYWADPIPFMFIDKYYALPKTVENIKAWIEESTKFKDSHTAATAFPLLAASQFSYINKPAPVAGAFRIDRAGGPSVTVTGKNLEWNRTGSINGNFTAHCRDTYIQGLAQYILDTESICTAVGQIAVLND